MYSDMLVQPVFIQKEILRSYVNLLVDELQISDQMRVEFIDGLWQFEMTEYRPEDVAYYVRVVRRRLDRLLFWYSDAKRCSIEAQMDNHKGDLADLTFRDSHWVDKINELKDVERLLSYLASYIDFDEVKEAMR